MKYEFNVMTQEQAERIAYQWHYDGEYSFYDIQSDKEDSVEFLSPERRGNSMFAVTQDGELIAFISVNRVANTTVDIGLGMRPNLTGKGKGLDFLKAAIDFIKTKYKPERITLSVATFNKRAIKVYRKIGFSDVNIFMQDTNGSTFEFLKMEFDC